MIPKLNNNEIKDRVASAMEAASGASTIKILRKRNLNGESSAERKLKLRIGKLMKSKIQPKTGVNNNSNERGKIC